MGSKVFWMGHKCLGDSICMCAAASILSQRTKKTVEVSFWEPFKGIADYFNGIKWVPEESIEKIDVGLEPFDWGVCNGVSRFLNHMEQCTNDREKINIKFNINRKDGKYISVCTHGNVNGDVDKEQLHYWLKKAKEKYPECSIRLVGHKANKMYEYDDLEIIDARTDDRTGKVIFSQIQESKLVIGPHTGILFISLGLGVETWSFRSKRKDHDNCLIFSENKVRWMEDETVPVKKEFPVVVHIPFHIYNEGLIRVIEQKEELCKRLKSMGVQIVITVDKNLTNYTFTEFEHVIFLENSNGIVNPTKLALKKARELYGNCLFIRFGQDIFIDTDLLAKFINSIPLNDTNIYGYLQSANDIFGDLKKMGLECKEKSIKYIQGNFIAASISLWEKYYLSGLPKFITHYKDDSIMSYLAQRDGIELTQIKYAISDHRGLSWFIDSFKRTITMEDMFKIRCNQQSDINEHMETLQKYASECETVTEFGVNNGNSTVAFLNSSAKKIISYDINKDIIFGKVKKCILEKDSPKHQFICANTLETEIEYTDMLFVDSLHTEEQVYRELTLHSSKVGKYLIFHDVVAFGFKGEGKSRGIMYAILRFMSEDKDGKNWGFVDMKSNNNGLLVLGRKSFESKKKVYYESPIKVFLIYFLWDKTHLDLFQETLRQYSVMNNCKFTIIVFQTFNFTYLRSDNITLDIRIRDKRLGKNFLWLYQEILRDTNYIEQIKTFDIYAHCDDDIRFTRENFDYFIEYSAFLEGTTYVPGFCVYGKSENDDRKYLIEFNSKHSSQNLCNGDEIIKEIIYINEYPFVYPCNSHQACCVLTGSRCVELSRREGYGLLCAAGIYYATTGASAMSHLYRHNVTPVISLNEIPKRSLLHHVHINKYVIYEGVKSPSIDEFYDICLSKIRQNL